jgi:hypothetical protein
LYDRLLKERWKRRKDEEEDVSRYWTALRKKAVPGTEELVLEVAMDLSQERLRNKINDSVLDFGNFMNCCHSS